MGHSSGLLVSDQDMKVDGPSSCVLADPRKNLTRRIQMEVLLSDLHG